MANGHTLAVYKCTAETAARALIVAKLGNQEYSIRQAMMFANFTKKKCDKKDLKKKRVTRCRNKTELQVSAIKVPP